MRSQKNKMGSSDELARYLFHQGTNYRSQEYLGFHIVGEGEYVFRTWAPRADRIDVVGDAFGWDTGVQMNKITDSGIWEVKCSGVGIEGSYYKYRVTGGGTVRLKSDPYAVSGETLSKSASIARTIPDYPWGDEAWMDFRRECFSRLEGHYYAAPLNVYEVHLGSWMTRDGKSTSEGENYLTYREIAEKMLPYVKKMGYTHVELLPVMEHPFDGSWGYQITGFFTPSARFGAPEDFMYFVDSFHRAGIGVILDWVGAHFPKDEQGLFEFDGTPTYEYQGTDRMEHRAWGTRCFDVGRGEVQSFLISNALFWLERYHVDGLRIDAVASMLYLDYDRGPGEWTPNTEGNNRSLEAISFFRKLNGEIFSRHGDVLMIAEESTAWPMVTMPVDKGGLGFNFKWNMGWANDMFGYVSSDPFFRGKLHDRLTFPLVYAFSENYILPVSHDEVVHGKCSLIGKMYGEYDDKFAQMRVFLLNMMTLPGKKLTFMGTEFAQFREWDYQNQLEWFMLDYPRHRQMLDFVRALNELYLASPELWELDDCWDGFRWIDADMAEQNFVSYYRLDRNKNALAVLINYSPVGMRGYKLCFAPGDRAKLIFSSDNAEYGGRGRLSEGELMISGDSAITDVPGYTAAIIKIFKN